jgi:hypothetical protein
MSSTSGFYDVDYDAEMMHRSTQDHPVLDGCAQGIC